MISAISTAVTFLWLQISYSGMFIQIEADVSVWVSRVVELHVCIVAAAQLKPEKPPPPLTYPHSFWMVEKRHQIISDFQNMQEDVCVCVYGRIPQNSFPFKWILSTTDSCVKRENYLEFVELHM